MSAPLYERMCAFRRPLPGWTWWARGQRCGQKEAFVRSLTMAVGAVAVLATLWLLADLSIWHALSVRPAPVSCGTPSASSPSPQIMRGSEP